MVTGHRRPQPAVLKPLWRAARRAAVQLRTAGIPHQLIGGLALAAHGYVRSTRDVDFLVGDAALVRHGALVTLHPAVPIAIGDIPVDAIPTPNESLLEEPSVRVEGVPVAGAGLLIFMKLQAGRRRDLQDVRVLIEEGIDVVEVRDFLRAIIAPDALIVFDRLVRAVDKT